MGIERRYKRQEERNKQKFMKKIHSEFIQNIKGKTDEQVMYEVERLRNRFGHLIVEEPIENIKSDDLIID